MSSQTPRSQVRLGTFHAACWMLGLVAFVELVAVGVVLALRSQEAPEQLVVERVVTEFVPVAIGSSPSNPPVEEEETPVSEPVIASETVVLEPFTTEKEILALDVKPLGEVKLATPRIADPIVERLVMEAREARVRDDYRVAIVKLEEAEKKEPEDPTVLYTCGEVFEAFGHYFKAGDYYEKVYRLGSQVAGSYYQLASQKISVGFDQGGQMEGKLTLGRVRQFFDKQVTDGEKVVLTVPIVAAPGQKIDPDAVEVDVLFFDKLDDKVQEATIDSERKFRWRTEPVDWKDTGEELLEVTYVIPKIEGVDAHLLGERKYHGQIVELKYSGDLLDHQAWPRTLARERNVPEVNPLFIPPEFIPDDLNRDNPLLPRWDPRP